MSAGDCGSVGGMGSVLIYQAKLLLQGLWHLRGRGAGQAEVHLDGVVDEPLQGGQSTDHDDTGNQALPHTYTGHTHMRLTFAFA